MRFEMHCWGMIFQRRLNVKSRNAYSCYYVVGVSAHSKLAVSLRQHAEKYIVKEPYLLMTGTKRSALDVVHQYR